MRGYVKAVIVIAGLSLPAVSAAQSSTPSLPAPFYDVQSTLELGFGEQAVSVDPTAHSTRPAEGWRASRSQVSVRPSPRFIIGADSIMFSRWTLTDAIAISDIVNVELVSVPARSSRAWVKVTYLDARGETTWIHFRRASTNNQDQLVEALKAAREHRAVRETPRG